MFRSSREFARVFTETIWKEFDVPEWDRRMGGGHLSKYTAGRELLDRTVESLPGP
jgi:hypothetical protein